MNQLNCDIQKFNEAIRSEKRTRLELELSPEMVDYLLSLNSELNRGLNRARVEILAHKILDKGFIPADDFKFYKGKLVNGQHRLHALRNLHSKNLIKKPYPYTGVVVNIPDDEAVIIDTAQTRTMKQRIYMATGKKFHERLRAAVCFYLNYKNHLGDHNVLNDEQVIQEMESDSWVLFTEQIAPNAELPNCYKETHFRAPVYCALKEAFDRCQPEMWNKFLKELMGEKPCSIIQRLRGLIENAADFGNGGKGRRDLYRATVPYLKAYIKGRKTVSQPCDWD